MRKVGIAIRSRRDSIKPNPHQMREMPLKWGQLRGRIPGVLALHRANPRTGETRRWWKRRRRHCRFGQLKRSVLGWTARRNARERLVHRSLVQGGFRTPRRLYRRREWRSVCSSITNSQTANLLVEVLSEELLESAFVDRKHFRGTYLTMQAERGVDYPDLEA